MKETTLSKEPASEQSSQDLRVCGEDILISRSIGKLESGRFALQTLRGELTALQTSGRNPGVQKLSVLIGLVNSSLTSLNDLSWRLQLRKRGASDKMVGVLSISEPKKLRSSAKESEISTQTLESMSHEVLIAKYNELALRRRILAEEFNQISDHAIALQRSRLYRWTRKFAKSSTARIDKMVDIACALNTNDT